MKAQVMLEFILVVGIAMVLGIVCLAAVYNLLEDAARKQRTGELNSIGYTIQDEIILATSSSDGYQRTFVVPQAAGKFEYDLTSTNSSVTLRSADVMLVYEIPECEMNDSINITKGNNTVTNHGSVKVNIA